MVKGGDCQGGAGVGHGNFDFFLYTLNFLFSNMAWYLYFKKKTHKTNTNKSNGEVSRRGLLANNPALFPQCHG